ncbi:MAG: hypothetical protein LBL43_06085 [Treponema sp.]|jgi:hypothetical protein|nr:hypothetical protein [Treponema sp.]
MTLPVFISLASLILCFLSMFFFRFYIKRRTSQERILRDIREELDKILTEIDRITDEDIRLIEERENTLKRIIEEADRRVKVYAENLSRSRNAAEAYAELGRTQGRISRKKDPSPGGAVAPGVSPQGLPPVPPALEGNNVPAAGQEASAPEPPPRSLGERAGELAGLGLSARAIASRLGVSIAEAELALAIREPGRPR